MIAATKYRRQPRPQHPPSYGFEIAPLDLRSKHEILPPVREDDLPASSQQLQYQPVISYLEAK